MFLEMSGHQWLSAYLSRLAESLLEVPLTILKFAVPMVTEQLTCVEYILRRTVHMLYL